MPLLGLALSVLLLYGFGLSSERGTLRQGQGTGSVLAGRAYGEPFRLAPLARI